MKQLLILFALIIGFTTLKAQISDPADYMNLIGANYEQIKNNTWDYTRTIAHNQSGKKIEKKRFELLEIISQTKKQVAAIEPYKGDNSYRDSVVKFLTINYDVLNNDYAKIVDMEEIAEQSYDLMEAYLKTQEIASNKLKLAANNLQASQELFAKKYNVILHEDSDEISQKLDKADQVYKYYNTVYLIFFKSYKQEAYLIDAYSRADISAMEQNKNQLEEYAQQGLNELKAMPSFDGDESLIKQAIEILNFYFEEASVYSPKQIDFHLKKERFQNVKKAFDAKPQEKRTKQDVDNYNNTLKEYNNGVTEFNSINSVLNNKRFELFNKWNETCTIFTSSHVSKR